MWGLLLVLVALVVVALVVGVGAWQRAGNPVVTPAPPGTTAHPNVTDNPGDSDNAVVLEIVIALERASDHSADPQVYAMPADTGWAQTRQRYQKILGTGWRPTGDCEAVYVPGEYRCRWVERTRLWPRSVDLVLLCQPLLKTGITLIVVETLGR